MARLPYPDPDSLSQRAREALARRPDLNVYRMLGHSEPLAIAFTDLVVANFTQTKLDAQLRELVIVRVGQLCGSVYEVTQHRRIARQVGLAPEKIEAIALGSSAAVFSAHEQAVLRFAEEIVVPGKVSAGVFAQCREFLDAREMLELTLVAGFYVMVCRYLETLEIDLDAIPG